MSTVTVHGTPLYHELRGGRPPLLFVAGATGDAGHWSDVADALADDAAAAPSEGPGPGAIIVTSLALRRPGPPRDAAVTGQRGAVLERVIGEGMAEGGPSRAVERFLRTVCGDAVHESFDPALCTTILAGGGIFFRLELEPEPHPERGAASAVACAPDGTDPASPLRWFSEASLWAADVLGAPAVEGAGGHGDRAAGPAVLVDVLRPLVARLVSPPRVEA